MPRGKNGDFISASHWGYQSKQGEKWQECPLCGSDVPINQMKRHPVLHKLVCPDCQVLRPEEEEI